MPLYGFPLAVVDLGAGVRRFLLVLVALAGAGSVVAQTSDAEAQYRVARRLAAEGSAGAAAALDRVVALDPKGPLADDALLDRAGLIGLPRWPEQRGRLSADRVSEAKRLLARILKDLPGGDRAEEAAYLQGLLLFEPVSGYDFEEARLLLLTLAARDLESEWSASARYALAWETEQRGDFERAADGYQRLRVDAPGTAVSARATAAIGRLRLRSADLVGAAAHFQNALDSAALDDELVEQTRAFRSVAVDAFLARIATAEALRIAAASRPSAVAAVGTAGALIAQRKDGLVLELDATGAVVDRWSVDQPLDVVATPNGLRYAITAGSVLRLEHGGTTASIATAGEFGSFSSGSGDDLGRIWVLDRRGERFGVIEPGSSTPKPLWRGDGARLAAPVWDGNRLLAVDTRNKSVIAVYPDGSSQPVVTLGLDRPSALAVDPAGRMGVLEARGTLVSFFGPDGAVLGRFAAQGAGMQRATDLAFGLDGTLQLIEEGSGLWWRAK